MPVVVHADPLRGELVRLVGVRVEEDGDHEEGEVHHCACGGWGVSWVLVLGGGGEVPERKEPVIMAAWVGWRGIGVEGWRDMVGRFGGWWEVGR